jgi:hypothetical protein
MDNRTCRICYGNEEDSRELGRLISPCKCTGTAKYVHIMCLQSWRTSSPRENSFFECDLCHYKYSLKRTSYAAILLSPKTRIVFTSLIIWLLAFLLGYVAHPVLETSLTEEDIDLLLRSPNYLLRELGVPIDRRRRLFSRGGWVEHHFLGTASIGVLGLFKFSFTYFYTSFIRRRRTLSLVAVLVGFVYALYEIYRLVKRLCAATLRRIAGSVVIDVPEDLDKKTQ